MSFQAEKPVYKPRNFRTLFIVAGTTATVLLVSFALGLGLGLGLHKSNTASQCSTTSSNDTTSTSVSVVHNTKSSWQPAVGTTFNYQLSVVPTSKNPHGIAVWFIDLFDSTADIVNGLKQNGAKVVCYFSAGSAENWRPDYNQFAPSDLGANMSGWPGENWVNTNSATVRAVMSARMNQAVSKNCDGIDPDNMDAYNNDGGGFGLIDDDAVNYATWLASQASSRNLAIGLKNSPEIIPRVINVMQWSVNEQCVQYSECDDYSGFIQVGKPVFNVEYPKGDSTNNNNAISTTKLHSICNQQANNNQGFTTILKNINLNAWIEFCNGTSEVLS